MTIIAELTCWGAKYHDKMSDKHATHTKDYAYHVYMMDLYTKILGLTLESDRLKRKYKWVKGSEVNARYEV